MNGLCCQHRSSDGASSPAFVRDGLDILNDVRRVTVNRDQIVGVTLLTRDGGHIRFAKVGRRFGERIEHCHVSCSVTPPRLFKAMASRHGRRYPKLLVVIPSVSLSKGVSDATGRGITPPWVRRVTPDHQVSPIRYRLSETPPRLFKAMASRYGRRYPKLFIWRLQLLSWRSRSRTERRQARSQKPRRGCCASPRCRLGSQKSRLSIWHFVIEHRSFRPVQALSVHNRGSQRLRCPSATSPRVAVTTPRQRRSRSKTRMPRGFRTVR
jgi:hypothetical protein